MFTLCSTLAGVYCRLMQRASYTERVPEPASRTRRDLNTYPLYNSFLLLLLSNTAL